MNLAGMQSKELLDLFEGDEFASTVMLASGFRTARGIAKGHPLTRELIARIDEDGSITESVLERIRSLAARPIDPRYESPVDAALFSLALVIDEVFPLATPLACAAILRAPNVFLAGRLAHELLSHRSEAGPDSDSWISVVLAQSLDRRTIGEFDEFPMTDILGSTRRAAVRVVPHISLDSIENAFDLYDFLESDYDSPSVANGASTDSGNDLVEVNVG